MAGRSSYTWAMRAALLALIVLAGLPGLGWAADSAVIVMYHRFGEAAFPSTNIRLDQFEAHLDHLAKGSYAVKPLEEIVAALKEGRELPDRTVAITMDDAYLSIYRQAWPRLKAKGFPFTLFLATDEVDAKLKDHLSWDQIREMAAQGMSVGSHTASHPHLPDLAPAEVQAEIARANRRFTEELGKPPSLFAYPYGEASARDLATAKAAGFVAAFGQHSGVAWAKDNPYYWARFPFNEKYGDLERFRRAVDALALPVRDLDPADPTAKGGETLFRFRLEGEGPVKGLTCYDAAGNAHALAIEGRTVTAKASAGLPKGRSRFTCTQPAGGGRWRHFGYQYYVGGKG